MLQNAYFLAKIGADTAENEQHFAEILPKTGNYPTGPRPLLTLKMFVAAEKTSADSPWSPKADGVVRIAFGGWAVDGVSKIGKISNILQIFGGLVLGCIKTKFCKKICVWQHFSSSTRFAYFCTAAISKF